MLRDRETNAAVKNDQKANKTLRVAAVQFESLPGDLDANFRKIETFVQQAASQGARLVIFPECCITGYWFIRNLSLEQLGALAEPIPDGSSTKRLSNLAPAPRYLGSGVDRICRDWSVSQQLCCSSS